MSGLLFVAGAVAVVVGVVVIGFGIPVNEFSFGNTLIIAGTTAAVGGLIIIGLGVVTAQLQRLAEALATRAPIRSSRPLDIFESAAGARTARAPGRIPFPPKPQSDAGIREPQPLEPRSDPLMPANMPGGDSPPDSIAPTLRNPDEAPVTVEDDVSLSPQHPMAAPAAGAADHGAHAQHTPPFGFEGPETPERRQEPTLDADWRPAPPPAAPAQTREPQTAYFDAMWPAEPKRANSPGDADAKRYEPKFDLPPRETAAAPTQPPAEPEAPDTPPGIESRTVAILKSGVVDGMGYTLYVDGSIEAELPQGTLRFASINELRAHLEKNA
ncbi:MAG: hypothetical protein HY543_10045 [Deltaproteobacteria bacterium]|nr:hypothetical protein [Deltaproteobacteria bacterium]